MDSALNYPAGSEDAARVTVAVAGATGYVGQLLSHRLAATGHRVLGLARDARSLGERTGVEAMSVDVADEEASARALEGVDVAYYLVHAMAGGPGFAERDRLNAAAFGRAAQRAGVRRIVYLGGLGTGTLSSHLESRRQVGEILRSVVNEVVELRAAVVLGAGSISYEMLRSLTERLPVMVCPRWVETRIQPLAESDLLTYLERARWVPSGVYELGSADATTYRDLMHTYAEVRSLARRRIITVPLVTPRLSSLWVDAVSPVNSRVSHALIESLVAEVVVRDPARTASAFGFQPLTVREAVHAAMQEEATAVSVGLFGRTPGRSGGVYTMRADAALPSAQVERVRAHLGQVGGSLAWYPLAWAWWLRIALGRLFGERLLLSRPAQLRAGEGVDWWTVVRCDDEHLELVATAWLFGEGWLGWRTAAASGYLEQVAAMRPRGLAGLAYWQVLRPIHFLVFRVMVRDLVRRSGMDLAASAAERPAEAPMA